VAVRARPRAWSTLATAAGIGAVFVGGAWATNSAAGLKSRFPPEVVALESHLRYGDVAYFRTDRCFLSTDSNDFSHFDVKTCLAADPTRANYLLLGDSHAAHLWSGLSIAYTNINFEQATVADCAPMLKSRPGAMFLATCQHMTRFVFDSQVPTHHYDGIILSARWLDTDAASLSETIRYLRRYTPNVYVFGPMAEYTQPLPRVLAYSILEKRPDLVSEMRKKDTVELEAMLKKTTTEAGGTYVSLLSLVCGKDSACITYADPGVPLLFDEDHLTEQGAVLIARKMRLMGELQASASAPVAEREHAPI
jgi:hypothetical protein